MLARIPARRIICICLIAPLAWAGAVLAMDRSDFERPLRIPFSEAAPYDPIRATLGKMLFFDPRMSGAENISCATCHNPSFGWEVPTTGPIGATNEMLGRQAPTILNAAWGRHYFWDGRAATLEEQAAGPITANVEMAGDLNQIVERLSQISTYMNGFAAAYPDEGMTPDTILNAIATYERTVVTNWAPFDRWVDGQEDAISEDAKRGFEVFVGPGRCADCHSGWNFTDNMFHDIGLDTPDIGRAAIAPDEDRSRHAFKTPGLRNIFYRAPYMHNGSLPNIEAVISHYVTGGEARPSLSALMQPLDLTDQQVSDLVAFLASLTAEEEAVASPVLPTE